jgi:hypothetical protein
MTQTGGNMIINGGIVAVLCRILQNPHSRHARLVARCVGILDNAMHSFASSFPMLLECNGLGAIITRIEVGPYHTPRRIIINLVT